MSLNATPPNDWGKLAGTVTGVTCQGDEAPIAGATIHIDSRNRDVTLTTDQDGGYAYWLSARNNPLTVVAAKDGYGPGVRRLFVPPSRTTESNFTLQAICVQAGAQYNAAHLQP